MLYHFNASAKHSCLLLHKKSYGDNVKGITKYSMKNKTATVIGSTGLIGGHLLDLLQKDSDFSQIKVLVRRPITFTNSIIKVVVIDFSNLEDFKLGISESDVIFCAIGTTNKKMKGNTNQYRKIDYDIPLNAAKLGLETGCDKFVFVSSLGANSKSTNFYLKLKGETEDALTALNIPSLLLFRPSLLLGKRKEFRLGEIIGRLVMLPLSFLIPTRMRPIKAYFVAKSMLEASKKEITGVNIYHYDEMRQYVN